MKFAYNPTYLYPRPLPVYPSINPDRSNSGLFLLEHDGDSLINRFTTRDYEIGMAPIRMGCHIDLYTHTNLQHLIQAGVADVSTVISDEFSLDKVFIEVMGELFAIDVSKIHDAKAKPMNYGETRGVGFEYDDVIQFDSSALNFHGERSWWHHMLMEEVNPVFSVGFKLNGFLNIKPGQLIVESNVPTVTWDNDSTKLTKFAQLLAKNVKVVAYTFKASFV